MVKISHSQLQVAQRCPYQWKLSYLDGWTPVQTSPLKLGSYIHVGLERMYKFVIVHNDGVVRKLTNDELASIWLEPFDEDQDPVLYAQTLTLLKRYNEVWAKLDKGMQILAVEELLEVPLVTPGGREVTVVAVLDLIFTNLSHGKLSVMDHKSSTNLWWDNQAQVDRQVCLYLGLLQRMGRDIHVGYINNLNTRKYKDESAVDADKLFARFKVQVTPEMCEAHVQEFLLQADKVLDPPYPKVLTKECTSCHFHQGCQLELRGKKRDARLLWMNTLGKKTSKRLDL